MDSIKTEKFLYKEITVTKKSGKVVCKGSCQATVDACGNPLTWMNIFLDVERGEIRDFINFRSIGQLEDFVELANEFLKEIIDDANKGKD